jgi:hypothetical protein
MAERMPGGGWRRKRLALARQHLVDIGAIVEIVPARQHRPAIYRFQTGQK